MDASTINSVNIGPLDKDSIFDQVEAFIDGKNLGGLANRIYFGLWNDVAAWPTDPSAPATIELAGTQTGDMVMKAGKGYELLLHVFAPGLHKKLLGFMNATKNEDLVMIAQDSAGQNYLMGCAIRSANL